MRMNFIDRLLARLDGKVAPLWISEFLILEKLPPKIRFEEALRTLIAETEKFNSLQTNRVFKKETSPQNLRRKIHIFLKEPIDLKNEVPLRLHLTPLKGKNARAWLLTLQLHHSAGDARALLDLTERFLRHLSGKVSRHEKLLPPRVTSFLILKKLISSFPALFKLLRPASRLTSRRAYGLKNLGNTIGPPLLCPLKFAIPPQGNLKFISHSELFFSLILSGIIAREKNFSSQKFPVRFRVPVDLRSALNISRTLENVCSAIPVEVPTHLIRNAAFEDNPLYLGAWVKKEIRRLLKQGLAWTTLLETLFLSRFASEKTLKENIHADLTRSPRSNTLVVTYVGTVDHYYADSAFRIKNPISHTPTWGVNGYTFQNALHINLTTFEGLWSPQSLRGFGQVMIDWARENLNIRGEFLC